MEAAGFVDTDGSKLQAVILSYDRAIPASSVDTDTYSIDDYGTTLRKEDLTALVNVFWTQNLKN